MNGKLLNAELRTETGKNSCNRLRNGHESIPESNNILLSRLNDFISNHNCIILGVGGRGLCEGEVETEQVMQP